MGGQFRSVPKSVPIRWSRSACSGLRTHCVSWHLAKHPRQDAERAIRHDRRVALARNRFDVISDIAPADVHEQPNDRTRTSADYDDVWVRRAHVAITAISRCGVVRIRVVFGQWPDPT